MYSNVGVVAQSAFKAMVMHIHDFCTSFIHMSNYACKWDRRSSIGLVMGIVQSTKLLAVGMHIHGNSSS